MRFVQIVLFVPIALAGTAAYSTEQLSLSLNAPDLTGLSRGNSITISVNVSGISAGSSIDYLAVTLSYDSSLFSEPVISPGTTIPDFAAFVSQSDFGLVDASYDSLSSATSARIIQDGTFLSFQLTPLAAGAGEFSFDFVDALGETATGSPIDGIAHDDALAFSIVPEPVSSLLLLTLFGPLLLLRRAG